MKLQVLRVWHNCSTWNQMSLLIAIISGEHMGNPMPFTQAF